MRTPPAQVVRDDNLWMVQRPRLLTQLDEATQRLVTLVIAPHGYGKRTLLDQWIAARRTRVVRLDGASLTPQGARRAFGSGREAPRIVVVDDAHHTSPDALDTLLDLLAEGTGLVLSGISRPPIALGGLVARGQVSEVCAADIAFTREEARALLETVGTVADHALDIVMETSLGWPLALRVLSEHELSWEREDSQLERIFAFLQEEVYPLVTDEELELLRTVAILPRTTPTSTHALTGDREAHVTLNALTARGFPLTRVGHTLTIHPLIRRHLVEQFAATRPDRHRELTARGVDWLAANGEILAAIRLSLESDIPVDAGTLLRRHFAAFLHTEPRELRAIVEACVAAHLLAPWEAAAMQSALLTVDAEVAGEIALPALSALVPGDLGPIDRMRLAGFQLLIGRQHAYQGVAIADALAVAEESSASPLPSSEALPHLAVLQVERGLHHLYGGRLDEAHRWLRRALTTARLIDLKPVAALALAGSAWVSARRGSVAATHRLADEAVLELAALTDDPTCPLAVLAHLARAMVATDLAEGAEAERELALARRAGGADRRETAVLLAQVDAMRLIMDGDLPAANAIIERCRELVPVRLPMEDYMLAATYAGSLLVSDHDRAATLAEVERVEAAARPEFGVHQHFRAHHLMRLDRSEEAYALLDPVVREGDVVVEKEWLQMLMAYGLAADRSGRGAVAMATFAAADNLASRIGLDSPRARHNLGTVERRARVQFTDAETHLLRNLTTTESIGQLAERLFLSPNTVKTHLRRIYRKLAVGSREEALERARVLRLL